MRQEPLAAARARWPRHLALGLLLTCATWVGEGLLHVALTDGAGLRSLLWPQDLHELWMRSLVAALMLAFTAHAVRDVRELEALRAEGRRLHADLDAALAHALAGFIPVCSGCKSIRSEAGTWQPMESYLAANTEAEFTHGLCPGCRERLYPGIPPAEEGPKRPSQERRR